MDSIRDGRILCKYPPTITLLKEGDGWIIGSIWYISTEGIIAKEGGNA